MADLAQSKEGKYITLKEAAQISGYAPDYVGQLIRKGKLQGKRIFLNEAWVTTEEALRDYMVASRFDVAHRKREGSVGAKNGNGEVKSIFENKQFLNGIRIGLWVALGVSVMLIVLLFYVLSVSLDRNMQKNTLERLRLNEVPSQGP
ncbi:MAG: hypothetical protein Q7S28_01870 [bacterium]|nr:hypothetical protein [bacterium]